MAFLSFHLAAVGAYIMPFSLASWRLGVFVVLSSGKQAKIFTGAPLKVESIMPGSLVVHWNNVVH
jgi:hypothetical protein